MKLSKENESPNEQDGGHGSKDKDKFVQFISAQNDDLILFRNNTIMELKQINQKINAISKKCEDIANAVEQIEDHSYQYNQDFICKFVRRMAKEKILAARKQTSNVQPEQLHLPTATKLDNLQILQHLTPRLQELLFEGNKYKRENHFKFCWVKNKIVCLRKTENDQIIKLAKLQDLAVLR